MTRDTSGIAEGYWDTRGVWHATSPETRAALLGAMGDAPDTGPPVRVVRPADGGSLAGPAELGLEDGRTLPVDGALPRELPLGYHVLRPLDGSPAVRLIVAP